MNTLKDLESDKVTKEFLAQAFRLVIDLSVVSTHCGAYHNNTMPVRELCGLLQKDKYFVGIDGLSYLFQVILAKSSQFLKSCSTASSRPTATSHMRIISTSRRIQWIKH